MMARWQRYELIAVDEVGYVPLADVGAEFLFQVISERAEKAALIVTTNLPFSEWRRCFPIRDCARRCWTASPTGLTSSRREPNRSAFGERWRGGGKRREAPGRLTPRNVVESGAVSFKA